MQTQVSKWGNSLAVRLPRVVVQEAGLRNGESVDLTVEGSRIVIAPQRRQYRLADLLKRVTANNMHQAVDTGEPVGAEVW
jgi:antitoxin MazE